MNRKQLHTGSLYWPTTLAHPVRAYEPLGQRDVQYDVVIVGGGMSGMLCGHGLANHGLHTAVVERGTIAGGSSSASTGLIQFSNDIMLAELADLIGEPSAVTFYQACRDAVNQLAGLAGQLPGDDVLVRRSSLYLASSEQELPKLRREYEMLRKHGFDVEWWTPHDIQTHFPFSKPGAIVTRGDAEMNPYLFVTALAEDGVKAGLELYEHTDIVLHNTDDSKHRLITSDGGSLTAAHVIFAVGYEPEELRCQFIKPNLNRSFVIVTGPQTASFDTWHERTMIWETARPYLYMRTTADNRVIFGGLDEEPSQPLEGTIARNQRNEKLHARLQQLFPTMTAPIEYEWCATFGESRDGLPFIGRDPSRRNVYYCLGYGGNGTVYSVLARQLLYDLILDQPSALADILRLDRPSILSIS